MECQYDANERGTVENGLIIFPTAYSIRPDELAVEAESRGYKAVLFPEHTHIPSSRRSPYPGGGELPKEYSYTYDPFVALSYAAAATTTLRIGTGIALVSERDPIHLAKLTSSLDVLSGGRFVLGVGAGWNEEEMENHGTDPTRRWALVEERIEAMRSIWTEEEATYHGSFVNFDAIWQWPKPHQRPHPPILLGGNGPKAIDRAARIADEWLPIATRQFEEFSTLKDRLSSRCRELGREPIPISIYGASQKREDLDAYAGSGVDTAYFWLPSENREHTLRHLDRLDTVRALP